MVHDHHFGDLCVPECYTRGRRELSRQEEGRTVPMPNRSKEVKAIAARYPQSFGPPDESIDRRRRLLIPIIVRELNKLDGNNWFLLNRLDRNDDDPRPGRLTSDVIVWGPTKEHVDVLSGSGAMWTEHPAITDTDWKIEHHSHWPSWDDVQPGPVDPPPPPPPPTGFDPTQLERAIIDLRAALQAERDRISALDQRIAEIDAKPPLPFELPELVAEGTTGRSLRHVHSIRLNVRRA